MGSHESYGRGAGMTDHHDLLLEWASERGCGSWQGFRAAHEWARPARSRPAWETPGFFARQLSALGHIEIDWRAGSWAAAPPVLTLLPRAGAHALLTGGRTRALLDRLQELLAKRNDLFALQPQKQTAAPSAHLIACESEVSIRELAKELDIDFTHSVSTQIAELLPPLEAYLRLARSTRGVNRFGVSLLDEETLEWRDVDDGEERGLYQYEVPHGFEFRLVVSEEEIYAVDKAIGIYAALARWGRNRLRYMPTSVNGELIVPLSAPLPTLTARAAVLCSGLAPEKRAEVLVYVNVPRETAVAIARSLDQSLEVIGEGLVGSALGADLLQPDL
jgi:hypothetical protein